MPAASFTKTYSDNNLLTEAMLDALKTSIEAFLNTTKIDSTNIQAGGVSIANLVTAAQQRLIPVGTIIDYGGTAAPSGYLACDGTAVSRTTYSDLFTAIGTTWGVGDGSTTFNLPSLARRASVGSGGSGTGTLGNAVGNTGGAETNSLSVSNMPQHDHGGATGGNTANFSANVTSATDGAHAHDALTSDGGAGTLGEYASYANSQNKSSNDLVRSGNSNHAHVTTSTALNAAQSNHTHTIANQGSGTAFSIMQPAAVVLKVIKY